ncbi:MAG: hypothetical protein V5A55_11555 [Halovenus sp.]
MGTSGDPTDVRSIAVTRQDLVAALEMSRTSEQRAVLRLTPPFSGRMRARLHVEQEGDYTDEPEPIHVDPAQLLASDAQSYPRPSETEDDLRANPDRQYTVERHHEYHTAAVAEWREAVPEAVRERVSLPVPDGEHEVSVTLLGDTVSEIQNGR